MIGASKILTVSYGTFSCTLEGFDEPFNTMKAIAEYFRDLAAEDRYFGAEPPTPDAAMLHKIAEREIHRRVEAKIQENGVILRAGDAIEASSPVPAPLPVVLSAPIAKAVHLNLAPTDDDDQPLLAEASTVAESVATKLSRLRATAAASAQAAGDLLDVGKAYSEDEHVDDQTAEVVSADAQLLLQSSDQIADKLEVVEDVDQNAADVDFPSEDFAEVSWTDDGSAESDSGVAAPIPALIAENPTDGTIADQQDDAVDLIDTTDQDAQDDLARLDGVLTDGLDAIGQSAFADHENSTTDQQADINAATAGPTFNDTTADDDALLASLGTLITENDQGGLANLSDDFDDEFDDFEDSFATDAVAEDDAGDWPAEDMSDAPSAEPTLDAANPAMEMGEDDFADQDVLPRARARVIKIRRADAAIIDANAESATPPSLLSAEAEAALQAELAALEAELPATAPPTPKQPHDSRDAAFHAELAEIAAEISAPTPPVRPQRAVRTITVARPNAGTLDATARSAADAAGIEMHQTIVAAFDNTDTAAPDESVDPRHDIESDLADEAVGRLMAQTNSAMDGADTKRRQSAIAHLKAAVVATEADRLIAPNQTKDDLIDSYRHDLESVVRPARPTIGDARAANADRPQPLVLVSAQRIDRLPRSENAIRPETVPRIVSPVRPRRTVAGPVAARHNDSLLGAADDDLDEGEGMDDAAVNMFAETESFADFADRVGASELPDLLEAAAVYCASVLGRPEFSRPLVLRQISTLPATADLSREDGLRVFGTLLRQGRIAKTRRGQFAVTDRSPLLAEALRSAS